jgi:prephenate dehydratase
MKVGYLGPKGTFSEKAAIKLSKEEDELIPLQPIRKVIMCVETGEVDIAVVPIENFYNGEVRETLDSLTVCKNVNIIKEEAFQIIHCLGVLQNSEGIKRIFSKDQALEQCSDYIYEKFPLAESVAVSSTSEAINRVIKDNLIDSAVIASKETILKSGLKIIKEDIVPKNKTRFVVISKNKTSPSGDDKTLLAIHPPIQDKPGILFKTLGFFANFEINLEDIKSRPDKKEGYYFYVELDGHQEDKDVKMALNSIKFSLDPDEKELNTIKVLGSYKNSHWKD